MKTDLITAWLYNEGYKHEIDADGDVHFRYEGKHMYFRPDEDQSFFTICMPGIYELENNRVKVLEACNTICSEFKVLKAFIINNRLYLAIEMFVDSTPEVGDFFDRCCRILLAGYDRIAQEIFKEN